MAAVRVDTTNYRTVYGQEPKGRGLWFFSKANPSQADMDEIIQVNGSYMEAKRAAILWAESIGISLVYTLA